jgi:transposase-like protein
VNGEIKRRADVAGVFANEAAILRLVGAVLLETHDGWQIAERRYPSEGSMAAIDAAREPDEHAPEQPALLAS